MNFLKMMSGFFCFLAVLFFLSAAIESGLDVQDRLDVESLRASGQIVDDPNPWPVQKLYIKGGVLFVLLGLLSYFLALLARKIEIRKKVNRVMGASHPFRKNKMKGWESIRR